MEKHGFFPASVLALLILSTSCFASEPDRAREQRLAEQIVDAIFDGEPIELEAGGHPFLAIYTEAGQPKGSVIILHGRGFHPDWERVAHPLRVGLVEQGWNTLSIQLPVLDKAATYLDYVEVFPDAVPRFEAAISYLRENAPGPIVIAAHSCGSHMAQHWILSKGEMALEQFDAYIGIGMGATDYRQAMVEPFALDKMPMPVLDIYGDLDYPAVLRMSKQRSDSLWNAGNPLSRQEEIADADHYFVGRGDALTEAVARWLETLHRDWQRNAEKNPVGSD